MRKLSFVIAAVLLFLYPFAGFGEITIEALEKDSRFFSGAKLDRTLIIEGLPASVRANVVWKTLIGPAVIEEGKTEIVEEEGGRGVVKLSLDLPEVKRRTEFSWAIELFGNQGVLGEKVIQYKLYPPADASGLNNILRNKKVGLFDPKGRLKKLFDSGGLDYYEVPNQLSLKTFDGDALIVGPGAISPSNIVQILSAHSRSETGILCLKQETLPAELPLPLRLLASSECYSDAGIIMAPGHPAFFSLNEDDFKHWRGQTRLAKLPMNKPFWGNYRSLMDIQVEEDKEDSRGSLILESFLAGKKLLFCQLPICEAYREEPVAGILLENLIRCLLGPAKDKAPAALLADPRGKAAEFYQDIGLEASLNPDDLNTFGRVIVIYDRGSKEFLSKIFRNLPAQIEKIPGRDGTLLILNLEPDTVGSLKNILPEGFELKEITVFKKGQIVKKESKFLWGIADSEWNNCLKSTQAFLFDEPVYELHFPDREKGFPLTFPPLIGQIPSRKGNLLICQFPFHRPEKDKGAIRLLCQFLTDLGFQLEKNEEFLQGFTR